MTNLKKNTLSFICLISFVFMALASVRTGSLTHGVFKYDNPIEEKNKNGYYLIKNNGEKIDGEKIVVKSGLLVKETVSIDGVKYKISEIKGYKIGDTYYGRINNSEYAKRIFSGKISIYVKIEQGTKTETKPNGMVVSKNYTDAYHYAQVGEDGPLKYISTKEDLLKLISDCPLAVSYLKLSNKKLRKAVRADPNYLNNIMEIYDNDCKE